MGDAGYVVRGRGAAAVAELGVAWRGPGDEPTGGADSRCSKSARDEYLRERGISVVGGGLDESPQAYKDIESVIAAQDNWWR